MASALWARSRSAFVAMPSPIRAGDVVQLGMLTLLPLLLVKAWSTVQIFGSCIAASSARLMIRDSIAISGRSSTAPQIASTKRELSVRCSLGRMPMAAQSLGQ